MSMPSGSVSVSCPAPGRTRAISPPARWSGVGPPRSLHYGVGRLWWRDEGRPCPRRARPPRRTGTWSQAGCRTCIRLMLVGMTAVTARSCPVATVTVSPSTAVITPVARARSAWTRPTTSSPLSAVEKDVLSGAVHGARIRPRTRRWSAGEERRSPRVARPSGGLMSVSVPGRRGRGPDGGRAASAEGGQRSADDGRECTLSVRCHRVSFPLGTSVPLSTRWEALPL